MNKAGYFADRLKEMRKASGLSQRELAEKAGLKTGGVRDLEQGLNSPRWETVLLLAEALGVDCTAFTQQPKDTEKVGRGRPKKAPPAQEEDKPKRGRGRPKKQSTSDDSQSKSSSKGKKKPKS